MHKKKYLIVGNWKMHGLVSWSALVKKIDQFSTKIRKKNKCRIVICPPSTLLHRFANEIKCKELMAGAQDCHELKNGAFTGCISANMLKNCGAKFVITGHSERRHIYNEGDKLISKKIIANIGKISASIISNITAININSIWIDCIIRILCNFSSIFGIINIAF